MGKFTLYLVFFSTALLHSVTITNPIAPGIKLSYLELINYVNFTTSFETQIDWRYLPEDEDSLKRILVAHLESIEVRDERR